VAVAVGGRSLVLRELAACPGLSEALASEAQRRRVARASDHPAATVATGGEAGAATTTTVAAAATAAAAAAAAARDRAGSAHAGRWSLSDDHASSDDEFGPKFQQGAPAASHAAAGSARVHSHDGAYLQAERARARRVGASLLDFESDDDDDDDYYYDEDDDGRGTGESSR
jgi:hypothetical protein